MRAHRQPPLTFDVPIVHTQTKHFKHATPMSDNNQHHCTTQHSPLTSPTSLHPKHRHEPTSSPPHRHLLHSTYHAKNSSRGISGAVMRSTSADFPSSYGTYTGAILTFLHNTSMSMSVGVGLTVSVSVSVSST